MLVKELIRRYPDLSALDSVIRKSIDVITETFKADRQLLLCGNGGSAADSEHIATEFLKGFMSKRPLPVSEKEALKKSSASRGTLLAENLQIGFKAIPLTVFAGLNTAFANDVDPALVFAQSVNALGRKGDILFCISTSGNAENVCYAAVTAKAKGLTVIALTGKDGGKLAPLADIAIVCPGETTPDIQERHLPLYHAVCRAVEENLIR
ncbi:MAG: SIS domain-containing protein [Fibrobacteres bacterium]|nr:SIS domain-containing protein [Fibrobacterota bacterium]